MCACVYLNNYPTLNLVILYTACWQRLKLGVRASSETWQSKMIKWTKEGKGGWDESVIAAEQLSREKRRLIGCSSHCWSVETLFHHSGHKTWSGSRSRGARIHRQTWSCGRSRRLGHHPCGWPVAVCSLPRSALPAPYSSRIADEASWLWETQKAKDVLQLSSSSVNYPGIEY